MVKRRFDYFFALQIGQVAQVALPSAQHCMPQADFAAASFLQQVDEQPVARVAAQTRTANSLMNFMLVTFVVE